MKWFQTRYRIIRKIENDNPIYYVQSRPFFWPFWFQQAWSYKQEEAEKWLCKYIRTKHHVPEVVVSVKDHKLYLIERKLLGNNDAP